VRGAFLDNGLLHIDLERPVPETRVRVVEIKPAAKPTGTTIDVTPERKG
jgi:hypothetical protein